MGKSALSPLILTDISWEVYKLKLKSKTTTEISQSSAIKKWSNFLFYQNDCGFTAISNLEVFINSGSSFFLIKINPKVPRWPYKQKNKWKVRKSSKIS